jgi:hypothetical protein
MAAPYEKSMAFSGLGATPGGNFGFYGPGYYQSGFGQTALISLLGRTAYFGYASPESYLGGVFAGGSTDYLGQFV